jgi:hypothetical protein
MILFFGFQHGCARLLKLGVGGYERLLKTAGVKLRLLGSLTFATKQYDRDAVAAKVAVVAIFIMLIPAGICFRDAYGLSAQSAAALRVGASCVTARSTDAPSNLGRSFSANLESHPASLQAVTRRWQGRMSPSLDGVNA